MKKAAITFLAILVIFNFIATSVFAADDTTNSTKYKSGTVDYGSKETLEDLQSGSKEDNWNSLLVDGSSDVEEDSKTGNAHSKTTKNKKIQNGGSTAVSGIIKALVSVLALVPKALNWILSAVVGTSTFTIVELLSNQYNITDIKFWEVQTQGANKEIVNAIRENVAIWYYSIRNIAIVSMVVILIYIGIRLVLLQVVDDASAKQKARYKQMIKDWFIGLALMLVLHILMVGIIYISDIFIKMVIDIANNIKTEYSSGGIETELTENAWAAIWAKDNHHPFWQFVIYLLLTFYQIKFFISYLSRTLKIYLYIIISPLVCMTYSIDKIGDNKSQAFSSWTSEFVGAILIQPVQLVTYTVFILSANELMKAAPLLLVIMLASISNINKIITKVILPWQSKFTKTPGDIKLSEPTGWFK